jgi:hypothetical protein
MAKPIQWLPRLKQIREAVARSNRSHWSRTDIEDVFGVKTATASRLLAMLPTVGVGSSKLVEAKDLREFLNEAYKAEDAAEVSALMERMRKQRSEAPRRKVLRFISSNLYGTTIDNLPGNLHLERGGGYFTFNTVEELGATMFALAVVMHEQTQEFIDRFEPKEEKPPDTAAEEVRHLFAELRKMQQERGINP